MILPKAKGIKHRARAIHPQSKINFVDGFLTFLIPPALMQDFSFIDAGLCLATRGPETAPETMVWAVLKYHFFLHFIDVNYGLLFRLPETGG